MEDWTFVDVTDRICIDIISESIDQIQIEDSNSISDDSYYNLNDEIIESENEEIIMQDSINLSTTKSYLQALLSKSQISVDSNLIANEENNKITKVKPSWKPTIIVDRNIKNERKDRLYQHNLTAQSIYTYEDEDDEYDSYFQSNEFIKGSVGVARNRSITMLTPAQLEKKQQRIAAKAH